MGKPGEPLKTGATTGGLPLRHGIQDQGNHGGFAPTAWDLKPGQPRGVCPQGKRILGKGG